jgi:hypothetical protein
MTIHYEVQYAVSKCPYCGNAVMAGHRRFGPKQVQCYSCKQIMDTDLTPWKNLSAKRKLFAALAELILPSWNLPAKAFLGNLLAWCFVSITIGGLGSIFIVAYGYSSSWYDLAMNLNNIAAPIIGFLFVPGQRLFRMIRESNQYSQTGIPPIWRVSWGMRKKNY